MKTWFSRMLYSWQVDSGTRIEWLKRVPRAESLRKQTDELTSAGRVLREGLPPADIVETRRIMARVRSSAERQKSDLPAHLSGDEAASAWAYAWAAAALLGILAWVLGPGAGNRDSQSADLALSANMRRAHEWVENASPRALAPLGREYEALEREIGRAARVVVASVP